MHAHEAHGVADFVNCADACAVEVVPPADRFLAPPFVVLAEILQVVFRFYEHLVGLFLRYAVPADPGVAQEGHELRFLGSGWVAGAAEVQEGRVDRGVGVYGNLDRVRQRGGRELWRVGRVGPVAEHPARVGIAGHRRRHVGLGGELLAVRRAEGERHHGAGFVGRRRRLGDAALSDFHDGEFGAGPLEGCGHGGVAGERQGGGVFGAGQIAGPFYEGPIFGWGCGERQFVAHVVGGVLAHANGSLAHGIRREGGRNEANACQGHGHFGVFVIRVAEDRQRGGAHASGGRIEHQHDLGAFSGGDARVGDAVAHDGEVAGVGSAQPESFHVVGADSPRHDSGGVEGQAAVADIADYEGGGIRRPFVHVLPAKVDMVA